MRLIIADGWKDYELLDTGGGERLERWGEYVLRRPDPQVIWPASGGRRLWESVDARYFRSPKGGGRWECSGKAPKRWSISYNGLSFYISLTGFKHTGLFPEQASNWEWMMRKIAGAGRSISILNLFAYTGGATAAAASAGASVCHVDAAKGMVQWAKDNLALSGLAGRPVRFITDDVMRFVQKEKRRGRKYDGIIMDPPSYGRGPGGEVWKLEDSFYGFMEECVGIWSDNPLFFLVNSYSTGFSPVVIENIMRLTAGRKYGNGRISSGEVGLVSSSSGLVLPCGSYGRIEAGDLRLNVG